MWHESLSIGCVDRRELRRSAKNSDRIFRDPAVSNIKGLEKKAIAKAKTKTATKWQSKPWEPTTFIFRGYNYSPYIGVQNLHFHGFGVQGSVLLDFCMQALAAHSISVETAKEIGRVSRLRRAGWGFRAPWQQLARRFSLKVVAEKLTHI